MTDFEDDYAGHPEQFPWGLRPLDDMTPSEMMELIMRIMIGMFKNLGPDEYKKIAVNQEFMDELSANLQRHFIPREPIEQEDKPPPHNHLEILCDPLNTKHSGMGGS